MMILQVHKRASAIVICESRKAALTLSPSELRTMNIADKWLFNRVDRIKLSPAVHLMSTAMFYLFLPVLLLNFIALLNFLWFGLDLCSLFLPLYEALGFPLSQRGIGSKLGSQVFCRFDVAVRPIVFLYGVGYGLFSLCILAANIFDGVKKVAQMLLFFSLWTLIGMVTMYSDFILAGFYNGLFVRATVDFIWMCILLPFLLVTLSGGLRTGNELVVTGKSWSSLRNQ
jgi:hypothetical protein